MKTNTRQKIFEYIGECNPITTKELVEFFGISKEMMHRHLKKLIEENKIYKVGTPPKVYYFVMKKENKIIFDIDNNKKEILENNFVNFAANGEVRYGKEGFVKWCQKRNLDTKKEIEIYIKTLGKYSRFKDKNGFIDGMGKLQKSFDKVYLDRVFYLDFYSIEKYGKTLLGNLMLYAKQTNNKELAEKILIMIKKYIFKLIDIHNVDSFAFIPPSIDRKIQLMDLLKKGLNIDKKELELIKIFKDKPVPQKSLNKKSDRIINARETIFIGDRNFKSDTILLIDDAVGSGATLNETAKKIKEKKLAKKVIGLAIVGSFKGFEVISEV